MLELVQGMVDKIDNPVYLMFLLMMFMGMSILWAFKRMLQKKDDFIARLTEQQSEATKTLSRLTTLIEILANRGGKP